MWGPPANVVRSSRTERHYHPLVIVLAAAATGILADHYRPQPLGAWWALATGGVASWAMCRYWWRCARHVPKRIRPLLANAVLLLSVAAAAAAWHHCRWYLFDDDDLGCYAREKAEPVCVEAIAAASPRVIPAPAPDPLRLMPGNETARLEVDLLAIRNGAEWEPAQGRATVLIQGAPPPVAAGDRLRCFGRLAAPHRPDNPGAFDYVARLRTDRIRSRLQAGVPECISVIESGGPLSLNRLLDRLRVRSNRLLHDYLDPRRAEMAAAILLGQREQVEPRRQESFMATGAIHLLVIAGLHLGILAGALIWIVQRTPLPRGWAAALVSVATVSYMLLVDPEPPIVRATVLVLVLCAAVWRGHEALSLNSLAGAALVVLLLNPSHLFYPGAQLSFLSVAGLMWAAPRWLYRQNDPLDTLIARNVGWLGWGRRVLERMVWKLTIISVVLFLLNMPLVMSRFHRCSPIVLILNTVVWIPMALSLLSGFALLLVGGILPPLAHLLAAICSVNLWLMESCVTIAQRLPWSHFWVPGPPDWWLWGFYGGLGLLAAFPRLRPAWRWGIGLLAAWIAVGFVAAGPRHNSQQLDCTFLSVGHGCATLLEFPSGKTMLYDAGQSGPPSAPLRTISEFLWSRGMTHLDAVVLSHPDSDHYNALPGLLERFSVGVVYVSPIMFDKHDEAIAALRTAIERCRVPLHELHASDRLQGGGDCVMEVLHPPDRGIVASDNANSIVLAVTYRGRRILLTGDLEPPGLDDLLAEEPQPCEVLLAPHHGSRRSNSPALAGWCRPRWVIFSDDARWNMPDIDATYQAVGGRPLHTRDCGAIHVRIGAGGVDVVPFMPERK
jgi:competence protein ComEC